MDLAARIHSRLMFGSLTTLSAFLLLALGSSVAARSAAPTLLNAAAPDSAVSKEKARAAYAKLPLAFVPNAGRLDRRVRYSAQAGGASFYFTKEAAVFSFAGKAKGHVLRLGFLGANPEVAIGARERGSGSVNYLIGSDPANWRTDLPTYGQVVYHDLWPGIDMVFRGAGGRLKYEFVLQPGAKVESIKLAYGGAGRLSVKRAGDLLIATPLGLLRDERPLSYQEIGGRRAPVASRFALQRGTRYGFAVGEYDRRRPLVIDPGLLYSTYLGAVSEDNGHAITVDTAGNAYVTGRTAISSAFPTTPGAFDTTTSSTDGFVTKLNPTGSALVYSTFLGGSNPDFGNGIDVDSAGNAYVTGQTQSSDFPTIGAFGASYNGGLDAFVSKLNSTGSALLYSTYLGGSSTDAGNGIAVDSLGNAYVTGAGSAGFPTTVGAFDTTANGQDAFVTKLNTNAIGIASVVYSTFLGGGGADVGRGIAVDTLGNAYVAGGTSSPDFPTTPGAFDTTQVNAEAFVTKLNTTGSAPLLYSTYLGGSGTDGGHGITVDTAGDAYVTGDTASTDFPTTAGAFDTIANGIDAFVTRLNTTGTVLYSTYLGGSGTDRGFGIAADTFGSAFVTGETSSSNFPTTAGAFDTIPNTTDAFVTKLNATGSAPLYSTYLGGSNPDLGRGITVDTAGSAYVTGITTSTNFPTTPGAFDTGFNGNDDAFITKLDAIGSPTLLTLSPATATNPVGTDHTVTATVTDAGGQPVRNVIVRFTVTGLEGTTDQCTTDGTGMCGITYTGPGMPSVDAITAYADTNDNAVQNIGEPGGAAEKTWVPGAPDVLLLDPAAATNPVGTEHTVTATVMDSFGNPTSGITVRFSITSPPSANSASDSCTTDASGQCSFSYTGTNVGMDAITAYADTDNNGTQDVGEPGGGAEKTWTPRTSGCPENGGDDDGDDDGLEDRDERLLFFTLLGDRDSDDDGRRDGNDDSDDDGRDDEDEDDDTDDECPNDSDGDGEDDEDEDDDEDDGGEDDDDD